MRVKKIRIFFFSLAVLLQCILLSAQDNREQSPPVLSDGFIGVNIGYINYPFTNRHLEPGNLAESIHIPHIAVRIILFGYTFNKNISMQISYMRPVDWVQYNNVNGDNLNHSVRMNIAGLTVKGQLRVKKKFSLYGEGGLGIITRKGFQINDVPVVKDANYATFLFGAGLQYHLNKKWDLLVNSVWSPADNHTKQPHTIFYSGGFTYYMKASSKQVNGKRSSEYKFPKNLLQAGYTTNGLGYGVNNAASGIHIFWGGGVEIEKGLSLFYKRNVYHSRKTFSFDWGAGASYWKSEKDGDEFFTAFLFPVFRITPVHTKLADIYFNYSVAGPAYISKVQIDGINTGGKFTFFDCMGAGVFAGKERKLNAEIKIMHFSNGNIFPENPGLKIPLTFTAGYTF